MEMRADATLQVEGGVDQLAFTLYHDYRVTGVRDGTGAPLAHRREGDYLWVEAPQGGVLTISYRGSSTERYSNSIACFLPGDFPFYPMAGLFSMYDINAQGLTAVHPGGTTAFRLEVRAPYPVSVSLPGSGGVYEGEAATISLAGGALGLAEDLSDGVTLFHPAMQEWRSNPTREKLQKALDRTCEKLELPPVELPEDYLVYAAPATMQTASKLSTFADHAVAYEPVNAQNFAFAYLCESLEVPVEKRAVLEVFQGEQAYINGNYPTLRVLRYCASQPEMLKALYARSVERWGEEEVSARIYSYLVDDEDIRSPRQFLEELCHYEEEVRADEEALAAV